MDQQLQNFIAQYTGKSGVGNTPENTGQCVGLIEVWTDLLNLPHTWGNADQLMANADTSKFDVVQNTPTGVPQAGDIMCWSAAFNGTVGHTGIFVSGDANTFQCFEQNDPLGSTPHIKQYDYTDVQGWLHPKVVLQNPLNTYGIDQTNIPSVQVVYDTWHAVSQGQYVAKAKYDTDIQSKQQTIDNLNQQINDRNNDITKLNGDVSTLKSQLLSAQQSVDSLTALAKQVPDLKTNLEAADTKISALNAEIEKLTRSNAQLKNNSYMTSSWGSLLGGIFQRIIRLIPFVSGS